jgi:aryl-alcohol dehydrogenase-like predicted oxidoreductase
MCLYPQVGGFAHIQVHSLIPSALVAIAYVMHKAPFVFPLVGGRKVEHLHENIKALSISLSPEQVEFLDSQVPFDLGFPHNMIVRSPPDGTVQLHL